MEEFRQQVKKNIKDIYKTDPEAPEESTNILCKACGKPGVKPNTVLYCSSLPEEFSEYCAEDFPDDVDLLIIIGTSLTVSPANFLPLYAKKSHIALINNDKVGRELGLTWEKDNQYFLQGSCDDQILELVKHLGWMDDFRRICPLPLPE